MQQTSSRALLKRLHARLLVDEVRIPIQTAAAVMMAYIVTSFFMSKEEVSWAAFSALFVVQASIGGTIGAALGRIAGAILGALIAVGVVMLFGASGWGALMALLTGVGLMSFLAAKWPVLARRTEQEYLAAALRHCGAYVLECTACMVRDKHDKDKKTQDAIQWTIERARLMAREARIEEKTPAMGFSPFSQTLLPEIERFAYTLTLVDRFSDKPISEMLCRDTKEALLALAGAVQQCLEKIAKTIEAGEPCEEISEAQQAYDAFAKQVGHTIEHGGHNLEDKEHIVAIKSAYRTVLANLAELARQAQGR